MILFGSAFSVLGEGVYFDICFPGISLCPQREAVPGQSCQVSARSKRRSSPWPNVVRSHNKIVDPRWEGGPSQNENSTSFDHKLNVCGPRWGRAITRSPYPL